MTQSGPSPFPFARSGEARRFAPATQRNREPIAEVLQTVLPEQGTVLEIASGTGEHVVHFAGRFPHLVWQPTDSEDAALQSIAAWAAQPGLSNILPPLRLDACSSTWPIDQADALLCINMLHISPWAAAEGLFAGAALILPATAPLYLYGPFLEPQTPTAPSNAAFDEDLRRRNPGWGLRAVADVSALAAAHGFRLAQRVAMPANNLSLVYRRWG